jgi:hypothetical protein
MTRVIALFKLFKKEFDGNKEAKADANYKKEVLEIWQEIVDIADAFKERCEDPSYSGNRQDIEALNRLAIISDKAWNFVRAIPGFEFEQEFRAKNAGVISSCWVIENVKNRFLLQWCVAEVSTRMEAISNFTTGSLTPPSSWLQLWSSSTTLSQVVTYFRGIPTRDIFFALWGARNAIEALNSSTSTAAKTITEKEIADLMSQVTKLLAMLPSTEFLDMCDKVVGNYRKAPTAEQTLEQDGPFFPPVEGFDSELLTVKGLMAKYQNAKSHQTSDNEESAATCRR